MYLYDDVYLRFWIKKKLIKYPAFLLSQPGASEQEKRKILSPVCISSPLFIFLLLLVFYGSCRNISLSCARSVILLCVRTVNVYTHTHTRRRLRDNNSILKRKKITPRFFAQVMSGVNIFFFQTNCPHKSRLGVRKRLTK